jgi:CubicO group peptidase (beta-lactamase class C family)
MAARERSDPLVGGYCEHGFEAVRAALIENFVSDEEVGAAVAVSIDGSPVVDLYGGHSDPARRVAWRPDTLVNVYSLGKGIAAILVLALVERGLIDLDAPVAGIWPEFAGAGKERVSVRTVLAHRAGLPAVRERLPDELGTASAMVPQALATQAPFWEPGERHGYHVITFGFLLAEIVRRVTGQRVGEALRSCVTGPLGADFFFGVPASEHHRIAAMPDADPRWVEPEQMADTFPTTGDAERDEVIRRAYFNPISLSGAGIVNTAAWRMAEVPSANGHGTARAVAAIYDAFLAGGVGGLRWVGPGLRSEATTIHSDGEDYVLARPSRFGLGFQLTHPARPLGPNSGAFGHYGHGGALGFADPETRMAFGYVTNRPGKRWQTVRTQRLIDAVYACL